MEILFVGIGGAFGSLTRYSLGKYITRKLNSNFPVGTFLINITGAFLLGAVSSLNVNHSLYLLLADGFLGAYTTFSTFMYEGFSLLKDHDRLNAVLYITLSVVLGLIGYAAGAAIAG